MIDPFALSAVVLALVIGVVGGYHIRAVVLAPGLVVEWRLTRWWFVWFPLAAFVVIAGLTYLAWFVHDAVVSIGWFAWYCWRRIVAVWMWR